MKIILFSDIHANLPALEAFFDDIEKHEADAIYCLGDLVGYNIWPNEVIHEIRKRRIPCIAGNYDQGIGLSSDDCGCAYNTESDRNMGKISIAYTHSIIDPDARNYLRTLPSHIKLEFQLKPKEKLNLLLVHGSPRKINEYLFEDREERSMLRIMEHADADILCFGHTHKPFHRVINSTKEGQNHFRHAVNTGSIGKPKDGNPQGGYVLISLDENSSTQIKESIQIDFIRFDYNLERAAKAIENSILPNAYAEMLKNGK